MTYVDSVACLKQSNKSQDNESNQLRGQVESLEMHLNNQDDEVRCISKQLEECQRAKTQYQQASQKYQEEANNLSADLQALTRENQILNTSASKVASERDALKAELRECDRQLQYLDQLIRNKDIEAQQLMQSYRKLIADHEKLDVAMSISQDDLKSARMELVLRDKRINHISNELDESCQMLNKYKIDILAFEKQCSSIHFSN